MQTKSVNIRLAFAPGKLLAQPLIGLFDRLRTTERICHQQSYQRDFSILVGMVNSRVYDA